MKSSVGHHPMVVQMKYAEQGKLYLFKDWSHLPPCWIGFIGYVNFYGKYKSFIGILSLLNGMVCYFGGKDINCDDHGKLLLKIVVNKILSAV